MCVLSYLPLIFLTADISEHEQIHCCVLGKAVLYAQLIYAHMHMRLCQALLSLVDFGT